MDELLPFAYAIINKASNRCGQVINTFTENWVLDNETDYSVVIIPQYFRQYVNKYYYDSQWWKRVVDETTGTYVDEPWEPSDDWEEPEEPEEPYEPSEIEQKAEAYDILMGVSE